VFTVKRLDMVRVTIPESKNKDDILAPAITPDCRRRSRLGVGAEQENQAQKYCQVRVRKTRSSIKSPVSAIDHDRLIARHSPPWPRRGGCATNQNAAKPHCSAQTGWLVQLPIIGGLNQPPRPLHQRRLRGIFIDVASTPPWPRRGMPRFNRSVFRVRQVCYCPVRRGIFVAVAPISRTVEATRL
jgi:hypothetical protein